MERKGVIYFNDIKDRSKGRGRNRKSVNISLLFIIGLPVIYGVLTLLCKSPEGVLWKSLYYNTIVTMLWVLSIIMRRPLILELFADFDALMGKNRKERIEVYKSNEALSYFYGVTIFFAACSAIKAIIWVNIVMKYSLIRSSVIFVSIDILNWVLLALEVIAIAVVICKIKNIEVFNFRLNGDEKEISEEQTVNI